MSIRTLSGRGVDELTIEALRNGDLTVRDFRISAETLRHQACVAEDTGYWQVAQNLRRAAELTALSNEEVLAVYDALRPGRAAYASLIALAGRLENSLDAPLTAALIREAAEVYLARGIISAES
jgi:propanediol dehydratase small subunit